MSAYKLINEDRNVSKFMLCMQTRNLLALMKKET